RGVNVLMDKPLEINVEKCDAVINACKKNKVRLGVLYPMHFNPLLSGIKRAIEQKLIGNLIMVDIHLKWYRTQEYYDRGGWRGTWDMDGGGSLMNQGAHPVDYMVWLCGEPAEITGDYGPLNHTIDTEDWAAGIIRFKNGVKGTILTTTNVSPEIGMNRIEVHGTEGSIMVETNKPDGTLIKVSTVDNLEELGKREFDYPVEQFIHAIKHNEEIEVTGVQGRASVAIINGVYRSANEGKRITV
ncbi:Gfo/Idh/MocA family protein, partial [Planctomycetota bacterium]